MKELVAKLFARYVVYQNSQWIKNPIRAQEETLKELIKQAKNTQFGKDHGFEKITRYEQFKQQIPVRDYEGIRPYIDQILDGKEDVLWPGKPIYFSKTSGTTSGAKYIPITKESMPTHIQAARDALLTYIHTTGKAGFINGKQIFLQGSPTLGEKAGIALGRLSGIVAHYVPSYLQK
ncbi:GH3 auxin-responsive promoter family protein, partial [Flavobacteriaceae bacterium]|nr:GH3 auxin-responsive promoter family protein [Flavobacteriaceae bacterium]